jgi:LAO/AO transport system kinase
VIIIETVGVGQSETAVAGMTDIFCLLQLPNAGDDLQAIKKGIMEIADLIVINKADINPQAANVARSQIKSALGMLRHASPNWTPPVLMLSALQSRGSPNSGIPLKITVPRCSGAVSSRPDAVTRRGHGCGN